MAVMKAATLPFISAAPRPYNKPSLSEGAKGSLDHSSVGPVGTTSVCPKKTKRGPFSPYVAHRLLTSLKGMCSILKLIASSLSAMSSWQPSSEGVIDCLDISSLVNFNVGSI